MCRRKAKDAQQRHWLAWTCTLTPKAVEDWAAVVRLAEEVLAGKPESVAYLTSLGGALFRAGRCGDAVRYLNQAAQSSNNPGEAAAAQFLLSLARHRLGQHPEAITRLKSGQSQLEKDLDGVTKPLWDRRLRLQMLRDEAVATIQPGSLEKREDQLERKSDPLQEPQPPNPYRKAFLDSA